MEDRLFDGPGLDSLTTTSLTGLLLTLVFGQFLFVALGFIATSLFSLFILARDPERHPSIMALEIMGYIFSSLLGFFILDALEECTVVNFSTDALPVCAMLSYNVVALWWPSHSRYANVFRWAPVFSSGIVKVSFSVCLLCAELVLALALMPFVPARWGLALLSFTGLALFVDLTMLAFTTVAYNLRNKPWMWPEYPAQGIFMFFVLGFVFGSAILLKGVLV